MVKEIDIGERKIGEGHPVYLVAEIGSNHCRSRDVVKKLITIAAETGFDAVKFQTYEPLEVFSGNITTDELKLDSLYGNRKWIDVARDFVLLPREWFGEMFDYAREKKLHPFSTVHSIEDAEFISQFQPHLFKVASLDVSYTDFLSPLAHLQKPLFLSTGMHYHEEIEKAVETILSTGNQQLALLHCVSNYPPRPEEVNLRNLVMLREKFGQPVGFSDHHPENDLAVAAVTLGTCVIEKHVTLDKNARGPDHAFALDADGMQDLVKRVRKIEQALGSYDRVLSSAELKTRKQARRSCVARTRIGKGEVFTRDNVKLTRPGTGIHPRFLDKLLGNRAKMDISPEEIIAWEMVEKT